MQKTRSQILDYLDGHPGSSAADLSRYLKMTPANIRYHLGILKSEGSVQVSSQRLAGGSGRPIQLYNLTPTVLGDNTHYLLEVILKGLAEEEEFHPLIKKVIDRIVEDQEGSPGNRISTFNRALAYLNQHHYRASWKATPDGPQVELRHCPYQDLAQKHPIICQVDEILIQSLFDSELELIQIREFGSNPFSPCIFKPRITT